MKSLIKKMLRATGYEIRRYQPSQVVAPPEPEIDSAELAELEKDLQRFEASDAPDSKWKNPAEARSYLTNHRLVFFHEVIKQCESHGINFDSKRIADVGSGTGYLLRLIEKKYPSADLTGFDTYTELVTLARFLCPNTTFIERDILDLESADYDVVFATEVIEHLIDPAAAIQRFLDLTNDNGLVFITVPDGRTDQFPAMDKYENGKGYWGHINFWSPESWKLFIEKEFPGHRSITGLVTEDRNYAVIWNNRRAGN